MTTAASGTVGLSPPRTPAGASRSRSR